MSDCLETCTNCSARIAFAAIVAVHAVFGCCWHHDCARAAITESACFEHHGCSEHHDGHKVPSESTPQPPCRGETCLGVPAVRATLADDEARAGWVAAFSPVQFEGLLTPCESHAAVNRWAAMYRPPLSLHLLYQSLRI